MAQAEGARAPIKVEFDNFEHGFPPGFGPGAWGHLAYVIGIAFAVFQLYVAAFNSPGNAYAHCVILPAPRQTT